MTSALAVGLGAIYSLCRVGMPSVDSLAVLKTVSLALFVLNGGEFFPKAWRARLADYPHAEVIACLALTFLLGAVSPVPLWPLFVAAGPVAFFRRGKTPSLWSLPLIVVTAAWVWGRGMHFPLLFESLAFGHVHPDMLIFPAGTQMVQTYGVLTTGVDGVVPIHYHSAGYWMFLLQARLLDLPILTYFQLGYSVIFVPLFFEALLERPAAATVILGVFGLLPPWIRLQMESRMGWSPLFTNESSTIVTTEILFFFSYLRLAERRLVLYGILPLAIVLITATKVDSLPAMLGVYVFVLWRLGKLNPVPVLLTGIAALVAFERAMVRWPVQFAPLALLRENLPPLPAICFLFAILAPGAAFAYCAWRERARRFELETFGVYALLCLGPGLSLSLPNQNALYFVAKLPFVGLALFLRDAHRIPRFVTAILTINVILSTGYLWKALVHRDLMVRANALQIPESRIAEAKREPLRNASLWRDLAWRAGTALESNPRFRFLKTLESLDTLPERQKRTSLIFIPQSDRLYWGMNPCYGVPFIAPALSGIAMLDGMPGARCSASTFSYEYFPKRVGTQPTWTPAELCRQAKQRGGYDVLRLGSTEGDVVRLGCS